MLYHAMRGAGFSNLPSEWWHYDFGNQLWAHYGGHPQAHFGPAQLDTIEERWKRQLGDG
ncbi:M15 family metallopeptidase [Halomonas ventosae]|uniref:M15 family metallopeptidase n=1 Tax=Halomonas ventosae TaxID=229007 RepID=UPI001FB6F241|nr:M15 family metallopeptidase [Halomonas ventosae]